MGPVRALAILGLAVAVSASPDGYTEGGVTPVSASPSPRPYRPRSPEDSIFGGSGAAGVSAGGYFPAAPDAGGRVISLGGGGRGGISSAGGEGMPYDFGWAVQEPDTGNDFTHEETSDGVQTSGQYRVNLPDGRVQLVIYTVRGDSGYQAEVTYEGEAQYPPTPAGQGYTGPAVSPGRQSYSGRASSSPSRYSAPSGSQQRYSSPSGDQQRYSNRPAFSASAAASRGYSNRGGRRYNAASSSQATNSLPSTQYGAAPSPRPSSPPPSTQYGAAPSPPPSSPAPSTQYGAAPSPRRSSPVPSTQYGAAPSTQYGAAPSNPGFNSGLSNQADSSVFGSRLTPLGGGVSYRGSDPTGESPRVEEAYGAPAAPSQEYGAV